jgi:hypothetical protein
LLVQIHEIISWNEFSQIGEKCLGEGPFDPALHAGFSP